MSFRKIIFGPIKTGLEIFCKSITRILRLALYMECSRAVSNQFHLHLIAIIPRHCLGALSPYFNVAWYAQSCSLISSMVNIDVLFWVKRNFINWDCVTYGHIQSKVGECFLNQVMLYLVRFQGQEKWLKSFPTALIVQMESWNQTQQIQIPIYDLGLTFSQRN